MVRGAFGNDALKYSTICKWYSAYKRGRETLRGMRFESIDELRLAVRRRLTELELEINGFQHVFREWIRRHRQVITSGGRYFKQEE